MKKLSTATMLALVLALLLGGTVAYAAFHWCPDDPKIRIGGQTITVLHGLDHPDPAAVVSGPVRVEVYVPKRADAEILETGTGWGHGEEVVIFEEKGLRNEVEVKVRIPTHGKSRFPVVVSVEGANDSAICEGTSNAWVECEVEL